MLYCIWLPLTCLGRLEHIEAERNFFELVNRGSAPSSVASYYNDAFGIDLSSHDHEHDGVENVDDDEEIEIGQLVCAQGDGNSTRASSSASASSSSSSSSSST